MDTAYVARAHARETHGIVRPCISQDLMEGLGTEEKDQPEDFVPTHSANFVWRANMVCKPSASKLARFDFQSMHTNEHMISAGANVVHNEWQRKESYRARTTGLHLLKVVTLVIGIVICLTPTPGVILNHHAVAADLRTRASELW